MLPIQQLRELIQQGRIVAGTEIDDQQLQPASLDLRLGPLAYRMQASFLPGTGRKVSSKIKELALCPVPLTSPTVLERNCIYLARLEERLALPPGISGLTNPKSTTGRLDVFTRVLTDGGRLFDRIPAGYCGPLWAEIVPRTFTIRTEAGERLVQLRLERGKTACTDDELLAAHATHGLTRGTGITQDATIASGLEIRARIRTETAGGVIAYRGRGNRGAIDLAKRNHYPMAEFWEPIRQPARGRLVLDPGEFYLLGSVERIRIPAGFAAELVPFDPQAGELRIHYAGFFDPGFGCTVDAEGTPAVLEVRAHETALSLEHGQRIGRLVYSRMAAPPDRTYGPSIGSSYHAQELWPGRQFDLEGNAREGQPAVKLESS